MADYLEEHKALENLRKTYCFVFERNILLQNISGPQKTAIQLQCRETYRFLKEKRYLGEIGVEVAQKLSYFYQKTYFEPGIDAVDFINGIINEHKSNEVELQKNNVQGSEPMEPQKKESPLEIMVKLKNEDDEGIIKKRGGISFL